MAFQLLLGITYPKQRVVQGLHHDLESFIWVALYAVLLHELHAARSGVVFLTGTHKDEVEQIFGRTSYEEILSAHSAALTGARYLELIGNDTLRQLIGDLLPLLHDQFPVYKKTIIPLTYDRLLRPFNDAIKTLQPTRA